MYGHASGFNDTCIEGSKTPPIHIQHILNEINLKYEIGNYIAVIKEIDRIIKKRYGFKNIYHANQLVVETLYYIKEFDDYKLNHENHVWNISDVSNKKRRCCF